MPAPALLIPLAKFFVSAAAADAMYEGVVALARKAKDSDPTGLTKTVLEFLESDQDMIMRLTLNDDNNLEVCIAQIQKFDPSIEILTRDELIHTLPDLDIEESTWGLKGKADKVIATANNILPCIQTQKVLNKNSTNTVAGRLVSKVSGYIRIGFR